MDSAFCAIWLISLSRNILHYLPPSKTKWGSVMFALRKIFFSINEVAVPDNTKKNNAIWQLTIQRYVFLLFFTDKCTQDVSKCFVYRWVGDKPTSHKIAKIWKNIWENSFTRYVLKLLFTSTSGNNSSLLLTVVNLGHDLSLSSFEVFL